VIARGARLLPLLSCLAAAPSLALAAGAPVTYVALGDSTALGVGARQGGGYPQRLARKLEASGVPVKLENDAVSGATVADLRRVQLPRLLGSSPALVTIGIGLNDVVHGRKQAEFARDLEVVADQVGRTKAAVIITTLPDLTRAPSAKGAPPSLGRRLAAFDATIRTVAERHGFQLVDLGAATRRPPGELAKLYSDDGFHPSAEGYDLWAGAMWPAVERALGGRVPARRPPPAGAR
jgi:acyl-CoA thioesterase I